MTGSLLRKAIERAFVGIAPEEAEEMISIGEIHAYPPGKTLCQEGEIESIFYIILEGEVIVSKVINESESRVLKPLGPGDFFGEYALIHDAPRSATVVTSKPTTVLEIHKPAFAQILNRSTAVSLSMVREVTRRLRENDEMALEDLRIKAGELASAYQQLAELDFARREFLTTIAHELRTPLTAASGFLQVIQMGMLQGEALEAALETVGRNLQQIITKVNDILFLQEMDLIFQDAQSVDIGKVVTSAVEKQRSYAESRLVGLQLEIAPELPAIMGDPESLERAVRAILENAIKFSPDGGDVTVQVLQDDGSVMVRVQDQGVGIPEIDLPRIFNRFYRREQIGGRLFDGVGLGLSIAQKVIEQHGGSIEVQSRVGEGSMFTIRLEPGDPVAS